MRRERITSGGAALTLIMLPLALVPPGMGSASHGEPAADAGSPRRLGQRLSPADCALARTRSLMPLDAPQPWRERAGDPARHARAADGSDTGIAPAGVTDANADGTVAVDAFAASAAGAARQRAVAQQAIAVADAAAADAAFATLQGAGHALQPDERGQWFALLLQRRKLDAALVLQQAHADLQAPLQQLAMAHALAESGRRSELLDFLQAHQPNFAREVQERQWLYLLAHVDDVRPELLRRHRVRFAPNRSVQARLASPAVAQQAGALGPRSPAGDFASARSALALRAGCFDEALRWCPRAAPARHEVSTGPA